MQGKHRSHKVSMALDSLYLLFAFDDDRNNSNHDEIIIIMKDRELRTFEG